VEVKTLQRHIVTLATLKETGTPVISCYLSLEGGPLAYLDAMNERVRALRGSFGEPERIQLDRAFRPVETYLRARPASGALGLALFSRSGEQPFFLPLEFQVPLPTWASDRQS
jgi:hypothetical protein